MARSRPPSTPIRQSADEAPAVAVVAVGNPIMGDDGVGAQVVERLEAAGVGDLTEVALANAGTTAFFALEAMSGCDRAIVIDAISTGAEPGTLHEYRYVDGAFTGPVPEMTMHDFSFAEALRAGREAYEIPRDVLILGVEPDCIEMSMELSEAVAGVVPDLVRLIESRLPSTTAEPHR